MVFPSERQAPIQMRTQAKVPEFSSSIMWAE
jgi:hypothetical protein